MPTSPTPITSLPTAPSRADPANFATRADAFLGALGTFGTQTNALGSTTYNNAVDSADSATAAGTSAGNAATSASNAAASATAAAGSATAAANSATSAAASYDAFDDRYLGSKASDPSVDNDGNALLTGALYWNTSANEMRVWNGAAWVVSYLPAGAYLQLTGGTLSGNLGLTTLSGNLGLDASGKLSVGTAAAFGTITSSGNVGATSSPSYFTGLALYNSSDGGSRILSQNAIGNLAAIDMTVTSSGVGTDDGVIVFSTAANGTLGERARVSSDGTFRVKGAGTAGSTDAVQFSGSAPASVLTLDAGGRLYLGAISSALANQNILTGGQGGGVQLIRNAGTLPTSGQSLGTFAWKGSDSANTNAAAEAMIEAVAAENFTGSTAATDLLFYTKLTGTGPGSAPTERARITSTGNFVAGNQAALATTATDGFLYVPTCAGTPTGVPTAITGMAPIVVNTTNNKLYFYSGGAWRDAGP